MSPTFATVEDLLDALDPRDPVYCIHPEAYRRGAKRFIDGFPGRVLYAVKANDHPEVLRLLNTAGVDAFDCASVPEVALVRAQCSDATPFFMTPARLRRAAGEAFHDHGVRHFLVDDPTGLAHLAREIDLSECVVFARMLARHDSAMMDFSAKYGATPDSIPALLGAIADLGGEPALAFNVGSSVTSPEAYARALGVAGEVLDRSSLRVRMLDIGGGFPMSYPGFEVPPLEAFFDAIGAARQEIPLADGGVLLAEPGRALAAPGLSVVTEVVLRKGDRLYLNDGMFGIFWELRFKGHKRYPCRVFRGGRQHRSEPSSFRLFGPTCDGSDVLPEAVDLPADIATGDHIQFGRIGAYSLAGRTRFNGFYSEQVVTISGEDPPGSLSS